MRICRISTVPYQVNVFLRNQIIDTLNRGHEVTVITSHDPEVASFCVSVGVRYIPLSMERRISPISDFISLVRLFKIYIDHRFDIVHSISSKAGFLSAIAGYLAKVPIRLHVFAGLPWETMSGIKRKIAIACDRLIVLLNTCCYADSNSQIDILYANGVSKIGLIKVLGIGSVAGVDLSRFSPKKYEAIKNELRKTLNIGQTDPIILFVGRVTRDKGISELVHSYYKIKNEIHNLHLIIVGPVDRDVDPVDDDAMRLIKKDRNIRLIGEDYEPEKYYAISDFLVMPSYREGFCNVVIEAAAMGKPTVATKVTGLIDSVVDGETGILVEVKSIDTLARAIASLMKDSAQIKKLGLRAQRRAIENFSQDYINSLLAAEYQKLNEIK